jgi:hypothetical protein
MGYALVRACTYWCHRLFDMQESVTDSIPVSNIVGDLDGRQIGVINLVRSGKPRGILPIGSWIS